MSDVHRRGPENQAVGRADDPAAPSAGTAATIQAAAPEEAFGDNVEAEIADGDPARLRELRNAV